jgi:cytochrome c553
MIRTAAMAILLATSFITHASEEAKAKADPAKGKVIAETVCVACHGADGNSPAAANPHLAGQVEEYLYKQLSNLKPSAAKDEKQLALGQKIWRQGDFKKGIPACAGCHGPAGAGLPAQYPRLAGQFSEYTEAQLKAFRVEERANDPEKMMRMIAAKLSDAEIKAVAEYAAGLR